MADPIRLKEGYQLAKCCSPDSGVSITGYFSFDDLIKVHRSDCPSLEKALPERLMTLEWSEILAGEEFQPDESYLKLEPTDFAILQHHSDMGVDYSNKVAADIGVDRKTVFEHHRKLRAQGLLKRVEPVMIRYRKGIVDNKWIKHRNHTYYELTPLGEKFLEYHRQNS